MGGAVVQCGVEPMPAVGVEACMEAPKELLEGRDGLGASPFAQGSRMKRSALPLVGERQETGAGVAADEVENRGRTDGGCGKR